MEDSTTGDDLKTVLIVDDNAEILSVISKYLQNDYKVLVADSGSMALEQARKYDGKIDLLLTDFEMPVMSGIELATLLTAERPNIKVLLMSGFTGGMLVLNEGWHFLAKPFIQSQLDTLIRGLVSPEAKNRFKQNGRAPTTRGPFARIRASCSRSFPSFQVAIGSGRQVFPQ